MDYSGALKCFKYLLCLGKRKIENAPKYVAYGTGALFATLLAYRFISKRGEPEQATPQREEIVRQPTEKLEERINVAPTEIGERPKEEKEIVQQKQENILQVQGISEEKAEGEKLNKEINLQKEKLKLEEEKVKQEKDKAEDKLKLLEEKVKAEREKEGEKLKPEQEKAVQENEEKLKEIKLQHEEIKAKLQNKEKEADQTPQLEKGTAKPEKEKEIELGKEPNFTKVKPTSPIKEHIIPDDKDKIETENIVHQLQNEQIIQQAHGPSRESAGDDGDEKLVKDITDKFDELENETSKKIDDIKKEEAELREKLEKEKDKDPEKYKKDLEELKQQTAKKLEDLEKEGAEQRKKLEEEKAKRDEELKAKRLEELEKEKARKIEEGIKAAAEECDRIKKDAEKKCEELKNDPELAADVRNALKMISPDDGYSNGKPRTRTPDLTGGVANIDDYATKEAERLKNTLRDAIERKLQKEQNKGRQPTKEERMDPNKRAEYKAEMERLRKERLEEKERERKEKQDRLEKERKEKQDRARERAEQARKEKLEKLRKEREEKCKREKLEIERKKLADELAKRKLQEALEELQKKNLEPEACLELDETPSELKTNVKGERGLPQVGKLRTIAQQKTVRSKDTEKKKKDDDECVQKCKLLLEEKEKLSVGKKPV